MKLLADMHISPRTVTFLRALGHDALRINDCLSPRAADTEIVEYAIKERRFILTQDLDFSAIVSLAGYMQPSIISLRLSSSSVEHVNSLLTRVLSFPNIETLLNAGAIFTAGDTRIRYRKLPTKR